MELGDQEPFDYLVKLVMVGESAVGKSSLLSRWVYNSFSDDFASTIGVDFKLKNLSVDDKVVRVQVWDTAGQERFRTITRSYYRGAHGMLLIYDCSKRNSFKALCQWKQEIEESGARPDCPIYVVCNKIDIAEGMREVPVDEAVKWCEMNKYPHHCVSARNNIGVDDLFTELALEGLNILKRDTVRRTRDIPASLNVEEKPGSSSCRCSLYDDPFADHNFRRLTSLTNTPPQEQQSEVEHDHGRRDPSLASWRADTRDPTTRPLWG